MQLARVIIPADGQRRGKLGSIRPFPTQERMSMDATSAGSYRIFTSLIVVLGALVFLSSTALASCPKGWHASPYTGVCSRYDDDKPVSCGGACDYCAGRRGAHPNETGGPTAGCKDCLPGIVCISCVRKAGCLDPNAPANPGAVNTTPSAGQSTYTPIHRLKIKPSSDTSGSQGAPPCLPPHILYNNGNCGCPSGLTGANCGELVVH